MLVKIEEIQGEKPLSLSEALKPALMQEILADCHGEYSLVEARKLAVVFRKVSGQIHLTGNLGATVSAPCKRCLKDVSIDLPVEFSLRMVNAGHSKRVEEAPGIEVEKALPKRKYKKKDDDRDEAAASFELDEVDAEPFDGKVIDLDPIVREQVLLALPVSVICTEECKGLCGQCGENLNLKDCGHGNQKEVDPRFAKLKDLKLKN
jgi:uncharacterized protein